ncbi:MAG: branched-chain amino acid ABC transporter permease [Candidatus Accumulibacter sp.]|jgi:ABC-type branched-subunit amino acid transport system permease subunit|nr:branched-chain amino acid ABC transporter permease [Accumulibacter sp.]
MRNTKDFFRCAGLALALFAYLTLFFGAEDEWSIAAYVLLGVGGVIALVSFGALPAIERLIQANERACQALMIAGTLGIIAVFREDHYTLFLLGTIFVYSAAVLGINVQLGYAGVINFSGASFFGIGGYTAAVFLQNTPAPPLLTLLLGGIFSAVIGSILLFPVLRTSGHYSALVTMAFALLLKVFLEVSEWLGGPQGLALPSLKFLGIDFAEDLVIMGNEYSFYVKYDLACLLLLIMTFTFAQRIERSWMGLAMDAVRIDETAAACFGISVTRWKITAFTMGNFVIGVAGALYSMMLSYINPSNFTFSDSLLFLSILLLGGIGSLWGVIAATAFMVVIPEKFQIIQEYRYLIYSAMVLMMIVFRPSGLLPRKPRRYIAGGPL